MHSQLKLGKSNELLIRIQEIERMWSIRKSQTLKAEAIASFQATLKVVKNSYFMHPTTPIYKNADFVRKSKMES